MDGEEKNAKRFDEPMPDVEAMPDDMDFDEEVLGALVAERASGEAARPPCEPPLQLDIAAVQRPPADS